MKSRFCPAQYHKATQAISVWLTVAMGLDHLIITFSYLYPLLGKDNPSELNSELTPWCNHWSLFWQDTKTKCIPSIPVLTHGLNNEHRDSLSHCDDQNGFTGKMQAGISKIHLLHKNTSGKKIKGP